MNKKQRDNLVKFFYTLSTASFTGLLVVSIVSRFPSVALIIIGASMVIIFATISYKLDGLELKE